MRGRQAAQPDFHTAAVGQRLLWRLRPRRASTRGGRNRANSGVVTLGMVFLGEADLFHALYFVVRCYYVVL